ncbi:organic cation/carnitine transporter 4-like [Phoenix dactylifera]|uniref:H(+)/Pi cotransporter n=1 Tax=Phoenix dactylifera TaxID=42345 RepID=A0A8B7CUM7_PHODC|nr:organic cation/carnitine transporter 4-like [Phoenix dactylifera]
MEDESSPKAEDLRSALLQPTGCSEDGDERIGVDEMLQKYSGEFGPWQLRHFALVSLAWALDAFHTMVTIFADREPAWRCTGPACSDVDVCQLEPGSWEWIGGREVSTVAEWGLVCGNKYKIGLVQSAFFAGCMVGCGIFGHLSDSFLGRKGSLMVGCVINTILGCLTAVSPSYTIYLILRVLTGLCTGPMGTTAFVLATEPVGRARRAAVGMSVFYFFSAGIVALATIAYLFPSSWRSLYLITTLPTLFFIVAILPFISESPRWYLIRRKPEKALEIMRSITKKNGRSLPDHVSLVLDCDKSHGDTNSIADMDIDISGSIIDVIRSSLTRWRLVLSTIISLFCSVTYYGLTLNVVNLKTNLYMSVIVNSVCEMPAFTLATLLLGRFGRRPLAIGTMWFSGAFCMAGSLMGGDGAMAVGRMACGMLGIFGISATYNLLLVYTAELFPTTVRNAALGCMQQAEQIGAVVAPMVVVMGQGLPFVVFGLCGIIGGVISFYLPETFSQPLYDTMAGMEHGEKAREGA